MWGMSYISTTEETGPMKLPCESLGHFYEENQCIYCAARYCITEKGGHSFEVGGLYSPVSPRFCYHCNRQVVNIRKG